jgi:hypothetical protein
MTHWALEGDVGVEIVNFLDDHSRLCLTSVVLKVTKTLDVLAIFQATCDVYGLPASLLTDMGRSTPPRVATVARDSRPSSNDSASSPNTPVPTIPRPAGRSSVFTRR